MVGLIQFVQNDYFLVMAYVVIITAALFIIKSERIDFLVLGFGFVIMILFEYLFISTGAETFTRNSLLGIMPVWLPFLWAYGFVAIKRAIRILEK